jgi:nitroimidazol reductase NimA-like FMN-containing flavoprotein (pyridoxamine 5'-phosphate oxidase superfamily)
MPANVDRSQPPGEAAPFLRKRPTQKGFEIDQGLCIRPAANSLSAETPEAAMDEAIRDKILTLLDQHRDMSLATLRPDGWPQATTVGYANDGLTLYFLCGRDSQKAANLARDDRVSLTIDHDTPQVMDIAGLSMAAHAQPVNDPAEAQKALALLWAKYPPQEGLSIPLPQPEDVRIFRLTPTVISVLDYTKGFGHTDLVTN